MIDIAAFVGARLDDDERIARAATDGPWAANSGSSRSIVGATGPLPRLAGHVLCSVGAYDRGVPSAADVEHITRHDPARVLLEVAAKRTLVGTCGLAIADADKQLASGRSSLLHEGVMAHQILRLVATVWSEHPDFDPGWRIGE